MTRAHRNTTSTTTGNTTTGNNTTGNNTTGNSDGRDGGATVPDGAAKRQRPGWEWQDRAACRGKPLALFFAPDSERPPARTRREAEACLICADCPVRKECLSHALTLPENYGVWGGMTEEQRTAERRRNRRSAA